MQLRDAAQPPAGGRDQRPATELAVDRLGRARGQRDATAGRGERGVRLPTWVTSRTGCDVSSTAMNTDSSPSTTARQTVSSWRVSSRVATPRNAVMIGRSPAPGADAERADAERERAVASRDRPAPIDQHRADPVQRALGEAELLGDVRQRQRTARDQQLEHGERRVDARRAARPVAAVTGRGPARRCRVRLLRHRRVVPSRGHRSSDGTTIVTGGGGKVKEPA